MPHLIPVKFTLYLMWRNRARFLSWIFISYTEEQIGTKRMIYLEVLDGRVKQYLLLKHLGTWAVSVSHYMKSIYLAQNFIFSRSSFF